MAEPGEAEPLLLCRSGRRRGHDLSPDAVRRLLTGPDRAALGEVPPTFAAVDHVDDSTLVAAADGLGFRHLYYGTGPGFALLSTSARAVAVCLGGDLEPKAIAVQSLLGWQIGQRTLFRGVEKLGPGELATLGGGGIERGASAGSADVWQGSLDAAVSEAAVVVREVVNAFLDEHPDAVLQLTGGLDSRVLLSAVPPERRRRLRCMTLGLPGNPDIVIAEELTRRCGLRHEVLSLDGIERWTPEEADVRCLDAARSLECMADPLAQAALVYAESHAEPGPRISGLGGEVARGFYYFGRTSSAPMTRRRMEQLARWRMFTNEAVSGDAFEPAFASWARAFTLDELFALTSAAGRDWMSASDDFYLTQRMQRWAGVTATSVCFERTVIDPMLDDRFIAIARGLPPRHKRNMLFLSRLQHALDADLARIRLDGRPAPITYTSSSLGNSARLMATTARKVVRKIEQRARRSTRPPAGSEVLARKLLEHWRANPAVLDPVWETALFREDWIRSVLAGEVDPGPSAVALITNLRVAAGTRRQNAGPVYPAAAAVPADASS
jgi:asparagine synthase (glutamine-hydrolysing)